MKIYKVERTDNWSYDDYDSFVCYAENEEKAKDIHPNWWSISNDFWGWWVKIDGKKFLKVTYIWEALEVTEESIILSSFNAG